MRLLFVLQEPGWPPNNGVRTKTFGLIRGLAARGHEVGAIFLTMPGETVTEPPPGVQVLATAPRATGRALRVGQVRAWLDPLSFPSEARWRSAVIAEAVARHAPSFDVVHLDMVNTLQYAGLAGPKRCVLSINDAPSLSYVRFADAETDRRRRFGLRRVAARFARVERTRMAEVAAVHVVGTDDARYLRETAGLKSVHEIPLAVETRYLETPLERPQRDEVHLLVAGNLNFPHIAAPTLAFLRGVWPGLRAEQPCLRLTLIGQAPPTVAAELAAMEGVHHLAFVDAFERALADADICTYFDASGTGLKNRVMQALASGAAVVGTRFALENLRLTDGEHALRREGGEAIGAAIRELARDSDRRRAMGRAARERMAEDHAETVILDRYEVLLNRVAAAC